MVVGLFAWDSELAFSGVVDAERWTGLQIISSGFQHHPSGMLARSGIR